MYITSKELYLYLKCDLENVFITIWIYYKLSNECMCNKLKDHKMTAGTYQKEITNTLNSQKRLMLWNV